MPGCFRFVACLAFGLVGYFITACLLGRTMLGRKIAIGIAAIAIIVACSAIAWVAFRNTEGETDQEGMLVSRQVLDDVTDLVRKENLDCPYALQGEIMETNKDGNVYRLSCGSRDDNRKPFRYRVTIRSYGQSVVEPW